MPIVSARKEVEPPGAKLHVVPPNGTAAGVNKKTVVQRRKPAVSSKSAKKLETLPEVAPTAYDDESIRLNYLEHQVGTKTGLLIVVGASVIFVAAMIYLSTATMPLATTEVASRSSLAKNYISLTYNFKVRYPKSWSYKVNINPRPGVLEEVVFDNGADKVVVVTSNQVSTSTLFPALPLDLNLNGTVAIRYHDYDATTGQPLDRVIIKRQDGTYQELLGYGSFFDRVVSSFTVLSK